MDPAQLDSMLAPIALYPDPLLSQILIACTYPLEIVQAYQWLQGNAALKGKDLTNAAQKQNWDPSVQALVAFLDVLKRLSQDSLWATNIGNAFLADQAAVMDSVQRLRLKAQQSGKLASTPQEKVTETTEGDKSIVEIQPADPAVIYVPTYDPAWVWGPPYGGYSYPYWDYPPAPLGGWCLWGPGIGLGLYFGWGPGWGWGWGFGWRDHRAFVDHDFLHRSNFRDSGGGGRGAWAHDPGHRLGVAYPNRALSERFHPAVRAPMSAGAVQKQMRAPAAAERMGNRQIGSAGYNRSGTAFGGVAAGRAAHSYSQRGNSSMTHVSSGGGSRGGGAHFGGGGGGHGGHR
jgi:hypothetical protein